MRSERDFPKRLLVAIGGNAIHPDGSRGTVQEQGRLAATTGNSLLPLMDLGNELIITHGSGPIVGKIRSQQVLAREGVRARPRDIGIVHAPGRVAYRPVQ